MDLFIEYIAERHSIHKKRVRHEPAPWTEDPILLKWKFTNVFREIDPGTKYVIDRIIPSLKADPVNLVFNVIVYRIYNKIETMNAIGFLDVAHYDKLKVLSILKGIVSGGGRVFTNAFLVSSMSWIDGGRKQKRSKVERSCILIERISDVLPDLVADIQRETDSEFTYKSLLKLNGIGPFLAYQIAVDLGYWNQRIFDENQFVVAGPGAKSGVNRLFKDRKGMSYEQCIGHLCAVQSQWFERSGVSMERLFGDRRVKALNLMAMENCLCEISKYLKVHYGERGRPRNRYKAAK